MSKESTNFLELFKEKKYLTIISLIENKIPENQRTPGLLNLLGVCKIIQGDDSIKSLNDCINLFRKSYLEEKNKLNSVQQLRNFINAVTTLFDKTFEENENQFDQKLFDEVFLYFNQNENLFNKDSSLLSALIKVYRRNLDIKNYVKYSEKIIKNSPDPASIAAYIYYNNYIYDWDQLNYFDNTKMLNDKLPLYPLNELVPLKSERENKISIAFISSDIRGRHSITFFLRSVINEYNRDDFKIYLYHNHSVKDYTTQEFEKFVFKSTFILNLTDIEVINLIRKDKIDIIIDLNGFSSNHRLALFKNRLAPTQISWCGYTGTLGIKEMDYLFVDKNLIYQNEESLYSEKVVYLPNIWNCHSGCEIKRTKNQMPFIKNNYITFCSFNNFMKINDDVIEVWSSILKQIENSKLILKSNLAINKNKIKEKFEKYGILNSIEFLPFISSTDDHLNAYKEADIALDTFPWNGVTTSFEAMWMGVPIITMKGFNFNSRCGESINKNINLENLIAKNKEEYVDKAISLAKNIETLQKIRDHIYENLTNSPLFNKKDFSKEFFLTIKNIYN